MLVFIVPYRNRQFHKTHFLKYMEYILEDYKKDDYEILIVNQNDNRLFNRGAMKNFGFIYVKQKYPDTYKNITLIFNDIDTIPAEKNLLDYKTTTGNIKHFYGFDFCLGGIFSITAGDFEKINGFPNYWTWGLEDNTIYYRANSNNINVDRSQFYKIGAMEIIHSVDEIVKFKKKSLSTKTELKNDKNGLNSLKSYSYTFDETNNILNINTFDCGLPINKNDIQTIYINSKKKESVPRMGLIYN